MDPCFKEFDVPSYNMRYKNTVTVFKTPNGDLVSHYVIGILDNGDWVVSVDGVNTTYPNGFLSPLYYYVESGFYEGQKHPEAVFSVCRKLARSFLVGVGQQYSIEQIIGGARWSNAIDHPNILKPVKPDIPRALEGSGALSKRIFLLKNEVRYLKRVVGVRHKRNFVVDAVFKSEIEDCLRGHECSITL